MEGRSNKRNWHIMLCHYAGETGIFITLVVFSYRCEENVSDIE